MALEKRTQSIDLLKGADTKQNAIITEAFHDMENVVFSGDMVAKKCPGYDLISTMTDTEDLSIMAKRSNDVIVQSSSSTYKFRNDISSFSPIGAGSSSAKTTSSYGDIIACGTNYNAYMRIDWLGSTANTGNNPLVGVWTFTDKNGVFINQTTISLGIPLEMGFPLEKYWNKWSKGVVIGDDFYFTHPFNYPTGGITTTTTATVTTFMAFDPSTLTVTTTVTTDTSIVQTIGSVNTYYEASSSSSSTASYDPLNLPAYVPPVTTTNTVTSSGFTASVCFLALSKFSIDSNQFSRSAVYTWSSVLTSGAMDLRYDSEIQAPPAVDPSALASMDMISDGTCVYLGVKENSNAAYLYKFNGTDTSGNLNQISQVLSETYSTNIELHNCNATYVYVIGSTVSSGISTCYLRKYLKSTLAFSSQASISTSSSYGAPNTYLPVNICWTVYPLSDTSAVVQPYYVMPTMAIGSSSVYVTQIKTCYFNGSVGLFPIGKIFTYNGMYYALCMQCLGILRRFCVLNVNSGETRAIFSQSKTENWNGASNFAYYSNKLSSVYPSGGVDWLFPGYYAIQEQYINIGEYLLGSFDDYGNYFQTNFSFACLTNQSIEISNKLFLSGAVPQYYDGASFSEHDLIGEPYLSYVGVVSGGSIPLGSQISIVACYQWTDASGNVFNSALSNVIGDGSLDSSGVFVGGIDITVSGQQAIQFNIFMPIITRKLNVVCNIYTINWLSTDHSSFQLAATIPIINNTTPVTFNYEFPPGSLAPNLYTSLTGNNTINMETFPASSMAASALFMDSLAYILNGDNDAIYFSLKKVNGYSFGFNEGRLQLPVYDKRGFNEDAMVGLHAMDGRLFIFKNNSILYTTGSNGVSSGGTMDFITPQLVTSDVGCTQNRSIVLAPTGIMFMSDKGIYLLDRRLMASYIGAQVERYNNETITSAVLLEKKNEVRFTCLSGTILVYNYFTSAWSWIINIPTISSLMINGAYSVMDAAGRYLKESTSHNKLAGSAIIQKISSPWIVQNAKQGWEKIYNLVLIGTYKSQHQFTISFYYDYELYPQATYTVTPLSGSQYNITTLPSESSIESGTSFDGVYQLLFDLPRKNCQAFRFVIQDIPLNISTNSGESFELANFTVTYGIKKGPAKLPSAKRY